ncbi:MAG: hypothetical protein AUH78_18565 [Gemmatimonadetes bacterium 13_1_40CM_4_69_8]|nr:MAG: hypothetical protein AUH78_18565 [Gemmatimonadetes bacterium 13_1_40CM_4_69_8]
MTRRGGRGVWLGALGALVVLACTDKLTAPGQCPNFCPTTSIGLTDVILTSVIGRDSSYGRPIGYVNPFGDTILLAATLPTVDSRLIMRFRPVATRAIIATSDTTTGPLLAPAAVRMRLHIVRRDTAAHNLRLQFYRLPLAIDSTTTFAALVDSFNVTPVRNINVDSLLAQAGGFDSVTGDSVTVDSVFTPLRRLVFAFKFDSLQIPWSPADSGKVALGIRVTADVPTTVAIASTESGAGAGITWESRLDSAGTFVIRKQSPGAEFDSFVFDPPPPALDSNLTVGGMPSARSLLRVDLPRAIRDSTQIVRATLILVPAVAAQGVPGDSFFVAVNQVAADFGAKSPLSSSTALHPDSATVFVGKQDTVTVEVTNFLRAWQNDTTIPRTLLLRQVIELPTAGSRLQEGATFSEIRFYSSRAPGYSPALQLTYIPRYPFGTP